MFLTYFVLESSKKGHEKKRILFLLNADLCMIYVYHLCISFMYFVVFDSLNSHPMSIKIKITTSSLGIIY